MKVRVLPFQSLADIAVRYTGSVENLYKIAEANQLSLDSELEAGSELVVPDDVEIDYTCVSIYENNNLDPATASSLEMQIGGINYMGIMIDFWVR